MRPLSRTRPRSRFAALLLLATLCGGWACGGDSTAPAPRDADAVLFVGNSLTYYNRLPNLVAQVAAADGRRMEVASVAIGNTALIDHANGVAGTEAVRRIAEGGWSAVVLQQGPTMPGVCRDTLVLATAMLDGHIRAVGARTAVLMAWPYAGFPRAFSWVRESAFQAAQSVDGIFLPAGDAWEVALASNGGLPLYGPDGYHPAPLGSLLTALVIYEGLTGRDVRRISLDAAFQSIASPSTLETIAEAAHAASARASVRLDTPSTAGAQAQTPRASRAGSC